ncbi:hypothetical protein [Ferruginibacter sp.]|nr:hypothetical protein [Ferruginibacter sp.]
MPEQIITSNMVETIKLIGAFAGLTALGLKIFEEVMGYIQIKVSSSYLNDAYLINTEVENSSKWSRKKIDNAFLIISPENTNILKTGARITLNLNPTNTIRSTNDFKNFTSDLPIYLSGGYAFIPLDFYYSENIAIGDEKLTYSCSIDRSQLQPGSYSVRFYVFDKKRYHRSTQSLMTIVN